jgi:hypothetical protein
MIFGWGLTLGRHDWRHFHVGVSWCVFERSLHLGYWTVIFYRDAD